MLGVHTDIRPFLLILQLALYLRLIISQTLVLNYIQLRRVLPGRYVRNLSNNFTIQVITFTNLS